MQINKGPCKSADTCEQVFPKQTWIIWKRSWLQAYATVLLL